MLSSDAFPRVRLGVGKKPDGYDMADWVLSRMGKEEAEALVSTFENVFDSVTLIIEGKVDDAMSKYNGSGKAPETDE